MPKAIIINSCSECPNVDHSGAYTPGGAQKTCAHRDIIRIKGPSWKNRVLPDQTGRSVPDWCPL